MQNIVNRYHVNWHPLNVLFQRAIVSVDKPGNCVLLVWSINFHIQHLFIFAYLHSWISWVVLCMFFMVWLYLQTCQKCQSFLLGKLFLTNIILVIIIWFLRPNNNSIVKIKRNKIVGKIRLKEILHSFESLS